MKVATVRVAGEVRVGIVDPADNSVAAFDLPVAEAARGLLAVISADPLPRTLTPMPLARAELLSPIPRPHRNIFCIGKNYHEHALEFARSGFDSSAAQGDVPAHPIVFSKLPETVVADGAPILVDAGVSPCVDYEAELAVIIGTGGRAIAPERALDHVWGYTAVNDVTARDLQGRHSQWLIGKSQDSFCPMGPLAVSRDEIDLATTPVRCWVNGDLRQDSHTGLLIFDVPTLIATISAGITLMPGDIIATGTPPGVGIGFDPPRYLAPGDEVKIEIGGIGALANPVEAAGHG